MAMRVVTPIGADFLKALDTCLDSGLITVKEWEHAVVEVYLDNQVDTGNTRCSYHYSQGCKPAKWVYIDHLWCNVEEPLHGYLCEACAEREMEYNVSHPDYVYRNLTPANGGVYVPDLHRVIARNWELYCRMAHVRGLRYY